MGKRCAVIVLNYNGKHLLPACLDSLALQQNADIEVIIVDNNSSDGSAAFVAEKYPKVKFLALDKNYGFSGANNFALRDALARGFDFVLLLNNDTFADPQMVAEMIAMMETDPRIAVVSPKFSSPRSPTCFGMQAVDLISGRGGPNTADGSKLIAGNSTTGSKLLRRPVAP